MNVEPEVVYCKLIDARNVVAWRGYCTTSPNGYVPRDPFFVDTPPQTLVAPVTFVRLPRSAWPEETARAAWAQ